ncbi:hypothetical protein POM88_011485 [Heracleum sosnowskyi]|uniref:Uncharacterized protein n=1 Tax=Heracleum sosnowskyi TaxID=360622 RepID=A0AAD8IWB6_9APIA|nr:hypothetical protein POM88_011485 [Heracleum sosnowskyi]
MGRKIAKHTRLFLRGNAWEYLPNQEELEKVEGLILDLTQSTEKQINSQMFERLPKLRLLEIRDVHGIKGHFKNSFHELRCIYWRYCTWTQLPSSFRPQKLISIVMPFSNFEILWDDSRHFTTLKIINVERSKLKSVDSKKSFLQVMVVRKHFLPFYEVETLKYIMW